MKKFIPWVSILVLLTCVSAWGQPVVVSPSSSSVGVSSLPGTVQADIAAMKAKIDTAQADIATIKTTGNPVTAITAGETHLGEIGGNTTLVSITPTITAGAYTANDCVGGIQTLTNAIRVSAGTAVLQSVTVRDLAMQNATLQILFFNASPATGTYGDADEFDLNDTDSGLCIGMVEVNASDYKSLKDNSIGMVKNIGLPLKATTGTSLFALIKTTGTPTYASTSDLKITFGLLRD
ncbi:MAG: hypothetical protein WC749_02105 [Dehalococcoidia bacterium]